MFARRLTVVGAGLLAAAALIAPSTASAVTTNLSWALDQSTTTYGGGTQFHISSGGSLIQYGWTEQLTKTTVISANTCASAAELNKITIAAYDQGLKSLYSGVSGQCFLLRGRVASGQGSTTTRAAQLVR